MKGLVLEGGGAKGAFHCGAVKALYDNGYRFDGVAGTSIGAINGALIVQDGGYETLMKMWSEIKPSDITDLDNLEVTKLFNKEFSGKTFKYWAKQAVKTINHLGVPTDKTLSYLSKYINEEKIRKSSMDYAIVTYCLSKRTPLELKKDDIPLGKMLEYIFASAYYPAFKLDRMDGMFFIDGGVYNNLPLNVLPQINDYDEIFAIRTMSKMPHKTVENDRIKVHYICPSEDLGSTVNISRKNINEKIKLGYYDTLRFIKGYAGYKYYIEGDLLLLDKLVESLTDDERNSLFGVADITANDIYHKFVEKNGKEYDGKIISFFESIAAKVEIQKFKIYSFANFLREITEKDEKFLTQQEKRFKKKTLQKEVYQKIKGKIMGVIHD